MAVRRLRRYLIPATAAVLLGPLIAVGVAWSLAAWLPLRGKVLFGVVRCPGPKLDSVETAGKAEIRTSRGIGYEFGFVKIPDPKLHVWDLYTRNATTAEIEASIPPEFMKVLAPWKTGQHWPYNRRNRAFMAFGWPMPALWTEYTSHKVPGSLNAYSGGVALPGRTLRLSDGLSLPAALPLHPIAIGLAVDTAVYAAGVAVVSIAVRRVQAIVRTGVGQCIVCRYDLRGLAPGASCPECGAAPTTAAE